MNSMLIAITSRAWIILLVGLGVLGFAGYSKYKASGDNAVTPEAKLAAISGKAATVTEVTNTTTRSRGGTTTEKFYEIEVTPASGAAVKLHMPISTPVAMMESIVEEDIDVKYDSDDNNAVYAIIMDGQPLRSYQETATIRKASAQASAAFWASPKMFAGGGAALLLGIVGLLMNRKLARA